MIKRYSYSTSRNKFQSIGKLPSSIKKELFLKTNGLCYICKINFELRKLELEHKVPVMLGGHLFDKENIDLICKRCHNQKTLTDKKVIKLMKDLKIIWGNYIIYSFYPLPKLKEFYVLFSNLLKESSKFYKVWEEGSNGIDYEEVSQTENREEKLNE